MEPIFLSLFANIIRMYAIYRCMEHFFLSKDENKISKICMYTGFVLVNSVGYYLFNNMFINISTMVCAPSSRQLKKYRFFATQIMLGSIFMLP